MSQIFESLGQPLAGRNPRPLQYLFVCNVVAWSVGSGNQTFNLEVTSLDANETASNPVLQVMFAPFNESGN